MRILLVEDELVVARSVAALLSGHRITTDIAGSGEDGLDHLRTYTYDAVVLDRMLPDMDGSNSSAASAPPASPRRS